MELSFLIVWNFEILKMKFWNFEKLKIRKRAPEMMKIPLNILQNIGYEFHIYQKHEMDIW